MGFKGEGAGLHVRKDPDDILDVVIDFGLWLADDTLASATATGTSVTVDSTEVNGLPLTVTEQGYSRSIDTRKAVIVWLSGGTVGAEGKVQVRITTVGGRQRDVTFRVLPRN